MDIQQVKQLALKTATYYKKIDPDIIDIYWFPCEEEIRLICLDKGMELANGKDVDDDNESVLLFYFSKCDEYPLWAVIGQINKKFFGKKKLPEKWGGWSNGIKM